MTTATAPNTKAKAPAKAGGVEQAKKEQADAKKLNDRLRDLTKDIEAKLTDWLYLIGEAKRTNVHQLVVNPATNLPWPSWQAFITDVLSGTPMLHAVARKEVASMLRSEDMSLPAISEILGVSVGTVWNDLHKADKPSGAPQGKPQDHSPVEVAANRIEAATKSLSKSAEKMSDKDRARLRKEMVAQLETVSTVADQVVEVLNSIRSKVGDEKAVPVKDLEKIQRQLRAALMRVEEELTARKAGRPARKSRGNNSRTGEVAA